MAEKINVIIPTIGESISEGTIGKWFFGEGDLVKKDQPLFELDSDKATLEVPASATGRLHILLPAGKSASVGSTVAVIEAETTSIAGQKQGNGQKTAAASSSSSQAVTTEQPLPDSMKETKKELAPSFAKAGVKASSGTSSSTIQGLGPSKRKAVREGTFTLPSTSATAEGLLFAGNAEEIRKPMSTIRKRIAERLVESQQTTATLTTFNEVDMSRVIETRSNLKEKFTNAFGVKLGFMSFFSKAVIEALNSYPEVNARIDGDEIVYTQGVHLGIAVSTERGLVVPVIRKAHLLTYVELEKQIADLAERGRIGKLQIHEMAGGTFTVTNGGIFGSLLSTPILNPPQSGILGMHKIEQRPKAVEVGKGKFEVQVRPMMYVALSYDHRLIDGVTSVSFLVKIKEYLESVTEDAVLKS